MIKGGQQNLEKQNRRQLGARYEEEAARYLARQGMFILYRNYRCHFGEIDLIAREGRVVVFVEVKYRRSLTSGSPTGAVGLQKQRRLSKAASFFLATKYHTTDVPCRFDVIGFEGDCIFHVKDAFSYHI